ncbi:MAG: iron ABC transporter permease [Clostridia bacterium]|nr:iron ABC transporter permease [Clostridia bacterium]
MDKRVRRWLLPLAVLLTPAVFLLCVGVGSVFFPPAEVAGALWGGLTGSIPAFVPDQAASILLRVRLPRVCTVALVGAALSVCGGAMQGLLKNPLADGSTLGVSSGASLGAVLAIALGVRLPFLPGGAVTVLSILFAFLSMLLILSLARALDYSLTTNTIILVGVIFSMFAASVTSLLVTFAGDKVKNIMFWTMGSFSGASFGDAGLMLLALVACGAVLLRLAPELNAFAIGEENARHIGVDVRRVKLTVMVAVSVLLGVAVSVSGSIGFVGLVIPHMTRFVTGPNHRALLPVSMWSGALFLMLADLLSRTLFSPVELPIGVITSFVGSVSFIYIFYCSRK